MAENGVQTSDVMIDFLDEIRKPNGNKKSNTKTFEDIVPGAWGKLKFEETLDSVALEKLLIDLILSIYDVEKATNNEEKRQTAQNRDVSLLMFGLLDGYYHTGEEDGKKVDITLEKRYEKYLNDGDFIKLDYPGEGTYQEIKAKDKKRNTKSKSAQPRPLNKLTKIAGDCKVEISRKLFELIKDGSYRQYIREVQGTDTADVSIVLPKPYYTTKNFQPKASESESDPTDSPTDDTKAQGDFGQGTDPPNGGQKPKVLLKDPPEHMPWKWILQLIASGAVGGILTCSLIYLLSSNVVKDAGSMSSLPLAEEIYVFNDEFDLPVGEKETLVIATNPPDADMDSIHCIVNTNPELVTIENGYDVRAQSQAEWRDEAEHTATIFVQGGHADKFPVEVTVINPGIYEDRAKDNLPNSED